MRNSHSTTWTQASLRGIALEENRKAEWQKENKFQHHLITYWTVCVRCGPQKTTKAYNLGSVQFSRSVVYNSLWPHGLQDTRVPCPSPTPRACSNSCPSLSVMPSNHLILCRPLLLLPPIFPSIRVFSSESALRTRWPKYWSLSFSNNSSNEYSGLISFRIDWFDLQSISPHSDTFFPSMRISRFTLFIGFFFFLFGSMTNFLWS